MAEFGWAYVAGGALTASGGVTGSIQFKSDGDQLTGSENLSFLTGSNTMEVTGAMAVSGTLSVSDFTSVTAIGNSTIMATDTTVPENYNSLLWGPITIGNGVSFTINANSKVKIKDLDDV